MWHVFICGVHSEARRVRQSNRRFGLSACTSLPSYSVLCLLVQVA